MSSAAVRIQAGTRLVYDGDAAQVVELLAAQSGVNVVLRVNPDHLVHVPLRELLTSDRVRVVPTEPGPASDDPWDTAPKISAQRRLNFGLRRSRSQKGQRCAARTVSCFTAV